MESAIHAHDVLHIIDQAGSALTVDELRAAVSRQFGAQAEFTNCQGARFTFDELITFMLARNKVMCTQDRLSLNTANLCRE